MEEKVNKLLDMMLAGIEKGSDLVSENAQPLFEEFYKYKMVETGSSLLMRLVISIFVLILVVKYVKWLGKNSEKMSDDDGAFCVLGMLVLLGGLIISLNFTISKGTELAQAYVAPKVYTINAIKETVVGNKKCGE